MPNRYEREIEEILRNLEHTEPKPGAGQKFGERFRRRPGPMRQQRSFSWHFSTSEWVLLVAIVAALLAGGYAYLMRAPDILSLFLAVIGFVCLMWVAFSQALTQPRRPRSVRYGNVTITPIRRSPLNTIRTQWNLFKLKVRYRRKNGH